VKSSFITSTVLSMVFGMQSLQAQNAEETGDWKHHISIYGWLPSFNGTFKYTIPGYTPGDPDEEAESNRLDNLDMVFMGSYGAEKDK